MSVFTALLLGLVQGIAEFLPISSSGHLSIFQNLFGLDYSGDGHLLFDVLLHLGTLVSICVVYKKDLRAIIADTGEYLRSRREENIDGIRLKPGMRLLLMIIAGTVPMIVGILFYGQIEILFVKTGFIGFALLVTGALLIVTDKLIRSGGKNQKTMTTGDAVVVGLAQLVALIPGLSRSGATISVGLSRGLSRDFAVKFSLLLSIPAIIGSTLVTLIKALRNGVNWSLFPAYLLGAAVAAVVGVFAIGVIRRLTAKGKLTGVAYYCFAVGVLTIILSLAI